MKKVLVFDLDGVLFDTIEIVNDFFLVSYPGLTKEIADEMLTGNFHEELEKIKLRYKALEETPEEHAERARQYSMNKSKQPMYPGIREFLQLLKDKGYTLTINTSALEKNCKPVLEYAKIAELFDFVATKEMSKSKVDKFKIIADRYNVLNTQLLFITDTLGDIREADTAGVRTIAVTWGAHNKSFFSREPHKNLVAIVDSVDELSKVVNENI